MSLTYPTPESFVAVVLEVGRKSAQANEDENAAREGRPPAKVTDEQAATQARWLMCLLEAEGLADYTHKELAALLETGLPSMDDPDIWARNRWHEAAVYHKYVTSDFHPEAEEEFNADLEGTIAMLESY